MRADSAVLRGAALAHDRERCKIVSVICVISADNCDFCRYKSVMRAFGSVRCGAEALADAHIFRQPHQPLFRLGQFSDLKVQVAAAIEVPETGSTGNRTNIEQNWEKSS